MYLAVSEEYRNCGYGSNILKWLKEFKSSQRIIADLERIMPDADNNDQRKRRNFFYIRNGFSPSGVCYTWREENYELYVHGGAFFEHEYKAFWKHFSSKNKDKK